MDDKYFQAKLAELDGKRRINKKMKATMEAEQTAKELAEILAKTLYKAITDEADVLGVDRKWYFENVVHYMTAESEDEK